MKRFKILAFAAMMTVFTAPAFSIVQFGANGNYISDKFSSSDSRYSGLGFGGFGRLTVGIPLLVTVAGGGYFDYGTYSGGPSTAPDTKQIRAGVEAALYLDVIGNLISLTPYARFGFGYVGNTAKTTILGTAGDMFYYGTGGHTIFGLTYKLVPMIYLFGEGGVQWSTLTASVPDALKTYSNLFPDITSQGWRASLGVMLWI